MRNLSHEIAALLRPFMEPGSANNLTADEIREWLIGLIADYAEEYAGRPNLLGATPMWDILAADCDPERDAVFAAAILSGETVQFLVGRGRSKDVRRFGDSEFPDNPLDVIDALKARFTVTGQVAQFGREDVDAWLK